jgi:oxysterol-binding protein-related protein 1/2
MALNEWTNDDIETRPPLPPTDSRWRPDIRKMETGDIDAAGHEKDRLEEKQRESRRTMEKRREVWQPRYVIDLHIESYIFVCVLL